MKSSLSTFRKGRDRDREFIFTFYTACDVMHNSLVGLNPNIPGDSSILRIKWVSVEKATPIEKPQGGEADMQKTGSAGSAACVIFVEAVSIFW